MLSYILLLLGKASETRQDLRVSTSFVSLCLFCFSDYYLCQPLDPLWYFEIPQLLQKNPPSHVLPRSLCADYSLPFAWNVFPPRHLYLYSTHPRSLWVRVLPSMKSDMTTLFETIISLFQISHTWLYYFSLPLSSLNVTYHYLFLVLFLV